MSICNWVLHSHLFTDFFWSLVDFYGSLYLLQKEEFWQKKKNEWQGQPLSIGIRICIQKQLDALLYSLWSPQWEVFVWVYTIKHEFASTTWALCLGRGLFITPMHKWHCFFFFFFWDSASCNNNIVILLTSTRYLLKIFCVHLYDFINSIFLIESHEIY